MTALCDKTLWSNYRGGGGGERAGPPERPGGPRVTSGLRGYKRACKRSP